MSVAGSRLVSPEVRAAAGKPERGTVRLSLTHRGDTLELLVADDGRGIDVDRVRQKAVDAGLFSVEDAAELTDSAILPLILHPGLSTATAVTEISSRGVGMDIVEAVATRLGGRLSVSSQAGAGTSIRLALPRRTLT